MVTAGGILRFTGDLAISSGTKLLRETTEAVSQRAPRCTKQEQQHVREEPRVVPLGVLSYRGK